MTANNEAKRKVSEVEFFEFCRRDDELQAIIKHSTRLFIRARELDSELNGHNEKLKNPWIWIFLTTSLALSFLLREARWYEFRWEWNFGQFMLIICFLYYVAFQIDKFLIEKKQKDNLLHLNDFEFRWDVVTGGECGSFWELRDSIDEYGETKPEYSEWLSHVYHRLEDKVSFFNDQQTKPN